MFAEFQCSMEDLAGRKADSGEVPFTTQQSDPTTCGQQCSTDAMCVAYVYDRFSGTCSFYSSMPRPAAHSCCTLNVKTCPGLSTMPSK